MSTSEVIDLSGVMINGVKLINLCPHDIHIYNSDGILAYTIPRSGIIARIATNQEASGSIGDIAVTRTRYGKAEGLPDHNWLDGKVFYIVETMVAELVCRVDVLSPDTFNGVVRDTNGQIKGVIQLQSFYPGKLGKL